MNKNITLLGLSLALLAAAIVSLTILSPYLALLLVVGAGLVCYFPARRLQLGGCAGAMRVTVAFWFAAFLALLLFMTLLSREFLRNGQLLHNWSLQTVRKYAETHVSFAVFRSVRYFVGGYLRGVMNIKWVLVNLGGNLIAFMPFAFFYPYFCRRLCAFHLFLPAALLTICAIEALQILLMTGYADIDDLIFNGAGCILAFILLQNRRAAIWFEHIGLGNAKTRS